MPFFSFPLPPAYSFRATVFSHGWYELAPFSWDEHAQALHYCWWSSPEAQTSLVMHAQGADLHIQAESELSEAEVLATVRWMLRLDEDFSAFYILCRQESALHHVAVEYGGRLLRTASLWEDALKILTTTNTTWAGTRRMCERLVAHFGAGAFPRAEHLADVTIETLREKCGLGYRADYAHALAVAVTNGALGLEGLKNQRPPRQDLYKLLRGLKGFGDYAATSLLMLLGYYEAVPVDSIARDTTSRWFYDGQPVTPAQIQSAYARFGPYAGLAYWFWKAEA